MHVTSTTLQCQILKPYKITVICRSKRQYAYLCSCIIAQKCLSMQYTDAVLHLY